MVKDLGSTNGTLVGGERVTEVVLKPGQIVRLGQVEMRRETGAPATAGKIPLDQTRAIPQGVKFDLEPGQKPVFDKNSPLAKKSNKTALIFITIGIILGILILILLVIAIQNVGDSQPRASSSQPATALAA